MLSIAVLLGDSFDDLDFFPLFAMLNKVADYVPVRTQAWAPAMVATSKCGFTVDCRDHGQLPARVDVVAVPGARDFSALIATPAVRELLEEHIAHARPIYTICSGIDLLQPLGVVDGFEACAHLSRIGRQGPVRYTTAGVSRYRWLTSIGGDGSNRYLKAIECFYRMLEDHFPTARDAIVGRTEIDSAFPLTCTL
jgi:putative intracellular protease/amidase